MFKDFLDLFGFSRLFEIFKFFKFFRGPQGGPGGPGEPQGGPEEISIFFDFFHKIDIFDHFDHILACFDLKILLSMQNYPRGLVQSFWGAPGLSAPPRHPRAPGLWYLCIYDMINMIYKHDF